MDESFDDTTDAYKKFQRNRLNDAAPAMIAMLLVVRKHLVRILRTGGEYMEVIQNLEESVSNTIEVAGGPQLLELLRAAAEEDSQDAKNVARIDLDTFLSDEEGV